LCLFQSKRVNIFKSFISCLYHVIQSTLFILMLLEEFLFLCSIIFFPHKPSFYDFHFKVKEHKFSKKSFCCLILIFSKLWSLNLSLMIIRNFPSPPILLLTTSWLHQLTSATLYMLILFTLSWTWYMKKKDMSEMWYEVYKYNIPIVIF
jgi:hypothetical protein